MNTTSRKPDSVSSVNITPAAPRSLRTICCTRGRERHAGVREALVRAVGDGAVVVERGEDLPDRLEDVVDAADVEEGLLLPGEGRIRQVLGRGGGADGK